MDDSVDDTLRDTLLENDLGHSSCFFFLSTCPVDESKNRLCNVEIQTSRPKNVGFALVSTKTQEQ